MMRSRSARRHALVGPPNLWEMKRRFQFEFLTSHGLRPESRLLDIGCGTLRGGIPLIDYLETGHYTGIEARANALEEGRKELADAGLEHKLPRLIHAEDPTDMQLDAPVDIAWAFAVLFHMRDETVDAYFDLVSRELADGGAFYANAGFSEQPEQRARWEEFPVIARPRELYRSIAAKHGLQMSELGRLDELGHRGGGQDDQLVMLRFAR